MKAAVLRRLGEPLTIEELEVPALGRGHVLVRTQLAAVCHSQKLEVSGSRGVDRYLPHLIGHEGVGIVEAIGPGVTKVRPGDQVVLTWIRGRGQAADPIVYASASGPINAGPIATFCETPLIAESCVVPIRPTVDPAVAVLAGCALPTGAGTVWSAGAPPEDGSMCVIGAGGVGLAAVIGAVLKGWPRILVVDRHPLRLARARELGATDTIQAGENIVLEEAIRALTPGSQGTDLVVECAGTSATMEAAIRAARPRGGRVILVGNLHAGRTIQVDPFDLIRGRTVTGSWGGGIDPDADIPMMVQLVAEDRVPGAKLVGRRFGLEQVNEAVAALADEEPGRPVLAVAADRPMAPGPVGVAAGA